MTPSYDYSRRTWLEACIEWAKVNRPTAVPGLEKALADEIRDKDPVK